MKKFWGQFILRGLMAASGGPLVLAIVYGSMGLTETVLTPGEVSLGIISVTLMAFIAAGITAIYQLEQLPLLSAILIHGGVLYLDYLLIYLINDWIPRNWVAMAVFTGVFVACYALIWVCIYLSIRKKTQRINQMLQ